MEFDKALEFAVTLAWSDLVASGQLLSARVEYETKRGIPIESLTVWTVRSWGYQDRVCDWTSASQTPPAGLRFSNNYHSDTLAEALDYIMKNQAQFPRPRDAWRSHLVLIQPPAADDVAQAAAWIAQRPSPEPRRRRRVKSDAAKAQPQRKCVSSTNDTDSRGRFARAHR